MADRTVNVKLDGDSRGYVRAAKNAADATDDLRQKAERFSGKKYEGNVGLDGAAKARAEVAELEAKLKRLERTYNARFNMNMRGAQRDTALMLNSISALGPAALTAAAVGGGAMVSLGASIGVAGAGLGTLVLGFLGVGDALKAMSKADLAAGSSSADSAAQQVASSRAIEDARRGVANAEQGLAQAHKQVTYALEDLHEAQAQAIRDLDDMRERVSDLTLDQEEADIRLVEARDKLKEATKSGTATELDLRKARLAVAQAEDRVSDVQRDAKRAREDLTSADRVGVNGMENVVNAQRSVETAQLGVRDAQRQVEDSQRRLSEATQDASTKMGKQSDEAKKLAQTMGELSPAGQEFVEFLYSLKGQLKELRGVAQEGMFPGLETGIKEMEDVLPDVTYLVDKMSRALGDLAVEGGDALNDPFWKDYIRFLGDEARPVLLGFFRAGESVARGLAGMQKAFNPLAHDVIDGLGNMAEEFATWGTTLEENDQFQGFIQYVRENGPKVLDTIGALASAIGEIATAAAPIGPVVLTAIQGLANAIGTIAGIPGVGTTLVAIAAGMGALNLALRAMEVAKFSRVGQFLAGMPAAAAGKGWSGIASGLTAVGKALPVVGVAALAAAFAYDELTTSASEADAAMRSGGEAAQQAVGALTVQGAAVDYIKGQYGSMGTIVGGVFDGITTDMKEWEATATPLQLAQAEVAMAQNRVNEAVKRYGEGSPDHLQQLEELRQRSRDVELRQIMAAEGVDRFTASIIYQNDVQRQSVDANFAAERAQINFESAVKRATEASNTYGRSSLESRDANLALRESALRSADAAVLKAEADAKASGESFTAADRARVQKEEYLRLAGSVKEPLRSELELMAQRVQTLPDGNYKVTGQGEIVLGDTVREALGGTAGHIADVIGQARARAGGFADGGILPGYTPGKDVHAFYSPTAGGLNLSGGEAIIRPEGTRALGRGWVDGINKAARTGGVAGASKYISKGQAFRDGGVFMTGVQPFRAIPDILYSGLTHGIVEGIAPQLDQQMRNVADMGGGNVLDWVRGEVGKPYIWGGTGPAGYDCSGLISAAINVMKGQNPHRRLGTTGSMPWPGMLPGLGPGVNVGSTRSVRGGPGHMAGTVNGVNIESAGGVGVRMGPRALGATSSLFDSVWHMPGNTNFSPGSSANEGNVGLGVTRWAGVVGQALSRLGLSQQLVGTTLRRMQQESGGNPRAINNWDSNARRGTPSKGLMQVIDPTFAAYRDRGLVNDIWDPLANVTASMRYALARYGSLPAAYNRAGGYDEGGLATGVGLLPKYTVAPERVLSPRQTVAFEQLVDNLTRPRPIGALLGGGAGPTVVNKHFHLSVQNAGNSRIDLEAQFSRLEARAGA